MAKSIADLISAQRADLGSRPDPVNTGRAVEARRLAGLLREQKGFSFARIGDFDLAFLLDPEGATEIYSAAQANISGTEPAGSPGLLPYQASRLRSALQRVSYLDFHERLWKDNSVLDQLRLSRAPGTFRNPDRDTSFILPTWLEYEFKAFCSRRRVLFCGAEVALLEALLRRAEFREIVRNFWPSDAQAFFLRPREDGRNLGANLDLIKNDLRTAIQHLRIDTLFLSLGGAAKILCVELAEECRIRAIDFGVCLRSLTYSGSDGNLAGRSTHLVFLHRVPFPLYMESLKEAYPDLSPEVLLSKVHAQLTLEIQRKEVGWTHAAWEYDLSQENLTAFKSAFQEYKKQFHRLFRHSSATRIERARFLNFCGTHRLTNEGRFFLAWFNAKSAIARITRRLASPTPKYSK